MNMHPVSLNSLHYPVVIVGGGQAGLSMSYCLKQKNIAHLVIEKNRIGHAWRSERWDSFCLVTPNWQCTLPGFSYAGDDPEGFMLKDDIVRYIEQYAASFNPPVREGVAVQQVRRDRTGRFEISTSDGLLTADNIVVAVGGYHLPVVPGVASTLPDHICQIHSCDYVNPDALPTGEVLVVGTGQSGCQIAEDLHLAGRVVHLCVGDAPRVSRRYRGKDVVEWLDKMKYYDLPVEQHPLGTGVREKTNHYVTGRDGGRDIDLRRFALEGMHLYGRLDDVQDGIAQFGTQLKANLDGADAVLNGINRSIDKFILDNGIDAPSEDAYVPLWQPADDAPSTLDLSRKQISTIIWCVGFKIDFSWINETIFDRNGYPEHVRGITPSPGLYFLGLPWQFSWGSGRFSGVARDAAFIADHIDARHADAIDRGADVAVQTASIHVAV